MDWIDSNGVHHEGIMFEGRMVDGRESYGVKSQVVARNDDGSLTVQDYVKDPVTGKPIAGKDTNFVVSEMPVEYEGKTYKTQMFTDSNTGKVLFVDGQQGKMWSGVIGDNHLTEHRGYEGKGKVAASAAERHMPGAGRWVGYGQDGLDEAGKVVSAVMKLRGGGKGATGAAKTGGQYNKEMSGWKDYFEKLGYKLK